MKSSYGHWEVAGKQYYNKLQSVVDAVPNGWWPHFNFHEEKFSFYDWTVEPNDSLDQLYQARARYIRQQYEFVALEFSGGADSWVMLHSFLKAGLHVDAIYHKYVDVNIQGSHNKSVANQAAEAIFQAYPWFTRFQELDPKLTWHTKYLTDDIVHGWARHQLDPLKYNNLHAGYITKHPDLITPLPDFIPNTAHSAMVYGTDKPNLFFKNNKFYLYFPENPIIHRAFIERERSGMPMTDVLFYWDPDCCRLLAKQAHIVMNWFRSHPNMTKLINNRSYRDTKTYYEIVNALVYPEFQNDWQSEKASGDHMLTHESWFWDNLENSKFGKNWKKSMNSLSAIVESTLKGTQFECFLKQENNYNVLPNGWSKLYYIGSL